MSIIDYNVNNLLDVNGEEGVTYWGWVDHGVSETLKAKSSKTTDDIRIISSRSHAGSIDDLIKMTYSGYGADKIKRVIAAGSGYKTIQVVQDKADLYLHSTKIKKWDTCAGNAIINSVGGAMTTLTGKKIDYSAESQAQILDGLVAATKKNVYGDFLDRIRKVKKS